MDWIGLDESPFGVNDNDGDTFKQKQIRGK